MCTHLSVPNKSVDVHHFNIQSTLPLQRKYWDKLTWVNFILHWCWTKIKHVNTHSLIRSTCMHVPRIFCSGRCRCVMTRQYSTNPSKKPESSVEEGVKELYVLIKVMN
jgi:hypothetical protein